MVLQALLEAQRVEAATKFKELAMAALSRRREGQRRVLESLAQSSEQMHETGCAKVNKTMATIEAAQQRYDEFLIATYESIRNDVPSLRDMSETEGIHVLDLALQQIYTDNGLRNPHFPSRLISKETYDGEHYSFPEVTTGLATAFPNGNQKEWARLERELFDRMDACVQRASDAFGTNIDTMISFLGNVQKEVDSRMRHLNIQSVCFTVLPTEIGKDVLKKIETERIAIAPLHRYIAEKSHLYKE